MVTEALITGTLVPAAVPGGAALALGAALLAALLGRPLPEVLRRLRAGKIVSQYQPPTHQAKSGTPSMAGLLFTAITLVLSLVAIVPLHHEVLFLGALLLAAALLGLTDDLSSSLRRGGGGMRARVKFGWLLGIAGVVVAVGQVTLGLHAIRVPFGGTLDLGPLYWPLAVLAVVGSANAVNLTDGLDGLAGGTGAIAVLAYALLAVVRGQEGVALFLLVLAGALAGFLWHNIHPARFFMGDTGALALGAVLAGAALLTGDLLPLVVIGAVFVAETLSVILQVLYFRRTGGRRIFRSSPLHNHFELVGWPETQIVQRFWLLGAVAAVAGVGVALTS